MHHVTTHALRACAAATALLALATGCSSEESHGEGGRKDAGKAATEAVRAAVAKVRGTSARIDGTVETRDGEKTYTVSLSGRFDLAKDKGKVAVDFPKTPIDHVDEIFDGDTIYARPAKGADKGPWGSVARDRAEAHYLLRAPLNDPEHYLRQIAAMRKVERFGSETLGGRPTTRYRGSIDHATLTLGLADKTRKGVEKIRDALGTDLPVFADAWVDREGRLVRLRMTCRLETLSVTTTVALSDFGKPVKAAAPDGSVPVTPKGGFLLG
ncbi:hypothetical protein [Streptomyces milbemycinicus]|uniref:hypothetical protein n=1 Tax=Streptomyces milbemycinicus TaxID=476552 RepID=UPI0033FE6761